MKYLAVKADTNSPDVIVNTFLITTDLLPFIKEMITCSAPLLQESTFRAISFQTLGEFYSDDSILKLKRFEIIDISNDRLAKLEPIEQPAEPIECCFNISNYGIFFSSFDNKEPYEYYSNTIFFDDFNQL